MEDECLEFKQNEAEKEDVDSSDLKEIDLEQAYEVGFF